MKQVLWVICLFRSDTISTYDQREKRLRWIAPCCYRRVAILKVRGRNMEPETEIIPLKTPRQMYVENVKLSDKLKTKGKSPEELDERARAYCEERVEMLIQQAEEERSGHPRQPKEPLIRLRVSKDCRKQGKCVIFTTRLTGYVAVEFFWFWLRQLAAGRSWIVLFAGAVKVNALAQGALRRFTQWPNTQPSNWEMNTLPLSYRQCGAEYRNMAVVILLPSRKQSVKFERQRRVCLTRQILPW